MFRRRSIAAETVVAPTPPAARRAIDGMPVEVGAPEPDYFAVMIDNIGEALPQSGVTKASLVIEAPVEGGITRLFAVYPSDAEVAKIGPVRSARPYYIDWAEEYGALYAHVGGSPEALDRLKKGDARDLNEFFNGASFWRDPARRAPHSTYTSTELLRKIADKRGSPRPLPPWNFKHDALPDDRGDAKASLAVGEPDKWNVTWLYDRDANAFARQYGKGTQKDAEGQPVLAKNVVVQFTTVRVLDEVGRRRVDTVSGGEALIAIDGRVIGGRWKKDEDGGRTRFYDAAGNQLSLNAGLTWIEVVPTETPVTY